MPRFTCRTRALLLTALLAVPSLAVAQARGVDDAPDPGRPAVAEADREAVRRAVLDYVEAVYETAPERVERSVSPELAKIGYYRPRGATDFSEDPMTYEQLLETARTYNRRGRDLSNAPRLITVFEVLDRVASAKLVATWGTDYLHLVKEDGGWKIRHVVWQSHTEETAAAARAAMERSAGGGSS